MSTLRVTNIQNAGATNVAMVLDTAGTVKNYSTISVGNVTPAASGAGITFPATQSASSDANTLDDYEEGTWTPTQGNFDTWTSPTFSATYTKIGRLVQINLEQLSGTIGWSALDYISGLPFAPARGASAYATDTTPSSDNGPLLIWTNSNIYFQKANASETGLVLTAVYYI